MLALCGKRRVISGIPGEGAEMQEIPGKSGRVGNSALSTHPPLDMLGHSNLISCCRWTDRLNILHFAHKNENLFLEINYDVILDHVTICRLGARI